MLDFSIKKDAKGKSYLKTSLRGKPLLTIPELNKGTAFTLEERHLFKLTGKLPAHIETLDQQVKRAYRQYNTYATPIQKNIYLNQLHNTNLVLFYKLVLEHIAEMLPIIYTPTVGTAVKKFSREFAQARGLYISFECQDQISEILENRTHPEVDLVVVTDGGGVLGIGDQGVGAMLIPVAKLMVYSICGGVNPFRTLPILLDVGTDNEKLLNDPYYLGWRHPRVTGKSYETFIAKFVEALYKKLPHVYLHWEDFGRGNARKILNTYRNQICTFNDDLQGTGIVALAALLAGVNATQSKLAQQRIVIFGAGTAGTGIADQIRAAMIREGLSEKEAAQRFWLIDRQGLLFENDPNLVSGQRPFARPADELSHWPKSTDISLLDAIHHIKPTALIGCSAVTGAFNKEVITAMATHVKHPIIFPLSNPTEKAEAIPQDLINWTKGCALIATGSPFDSVHYRGKTIPIAQCNNALAFPGLGLAITATQAKNVTDDLLWLACQTLAKQAPINKDIQAPLLPTLENARDSAYAIACAVAEQIFVNQLAGIAKPKDIRAHIKKCVWTPEYLSFHQ